MLLAGSLLSDISPHFCYVCTCSVYPCYHGKLIKSSETPSIIKLSQCIIKTEKRVLQVNNKTKCNNFMVCLYNTEWNGNCSLSAYFSRCAKLWELEPHFYSVTCRNLNGCHLGQIRRPRQFYCFFWFWPNYIFQRDFSLLNTFSSAFYQITLPHKLIL